MASLKDNIALELAAALNSLLNQVYQMEGMFPDDKELQDAIKDARKALERYWRYI